MQKKNLPITSEEKEWLSPFTSDLPSHVAHPVGCSKCNQTGYSGREGIYETILFDAEVTQLIYSGRPIAEIREVIRKRGDTLISHHAVEKVKNLVFPPKDVYAKVLVEEAKIDQDVSQEVKAKEPVIEELSEDFFCNEYRVS